LSAFFAIEKSEFLNKKTKRTDIIKFFKTIKEDFDKMFLMVEDYTPFNQNKLIPLFINRKKYYFFYGLIENPYTRINVLSNIINDLEEYPFFEDYKKSFFNSLLFQTNILTQLIKDEESQKEIEDIYIPSQKYFDRHSTTLMSKNSDIKFHCELGCLKSKKDTLINDCFNFRTPYLFQSVFAKINDKTFIILPHFHIEYFGYNFKSIINNQENYNNVWSEIGKQFKRRVDILCTKFFNINTKVFEIYANKNSKENLLIKYDIASCFLVDQNKLLVFKTIKHKENKDYSSTNETFNTSKNELKEFNKEISESSEIGFNIYSYNHIFGIKTENLEIWNILINENISLEQDAVFLDKSGENEHFVEVGDLAFLFDKFFEFRNDAPIHFIKFLQNDRDLMNSQNQMLLTN